MLESEYENRLEFFRQSILALPTTELKYHLFLLLTAIEQTNTQQTRDILAVSIDLTLQCQQFLILKQNSPELRNQIHLVNKRYDSLARLINKYDSNFVFYPHLLTIGCAILAIITGIFFAILGGVTGLATGIMNQQNPLKFFALGLLVGLCMGGAIGNRAPEYILETPLIRQLRFALRGLTENLRHLSTSKKSFHEYLDDVLEELLKKNFDGNQEKLEQFLQSRTSYQVATHPAQFVSKKLKGYVGQHAFIIIDIPNRKPFTLEFATSPSKTDKNQSNASRRKRLGKPSLK